MFTYEQIQSLNDLELAVYNYVITHMEQCVHMKIRDLAEAVHISTTTILRFCTKVNCEGYAELKLRIKLYLQEHDCLAPQDDLRYITKFIDEVQSDKYETLLEQACDMIMASDNIIMRGTGSSGVLGEYGARYLSNIGCYCQYCIDPFYPIPDKDLSKYTVIVLSVSGEGKECIDMLTRYKEQHANIIAFTNSENCTIAHMADLAISYYMPFIKLNHEYNITTQAPVVILLEIIGRKIQKRLLEHK